MCVVSFRLLYCECFGCESAEKGEKSDEDEQIVFCHRRKLEYMYADGGMWCVNSMREVDSSCFYFLGCDWCVSSTFETS